MTPRKQKNLSVITEGNKEPAPQVADTLVISKLNPTSAPEGELETYLIGTTPSGTEIYGKRIKGSSTQ